ncbi:MAG: glycosyltransferase [Prevotella sp.]|nr:glycosyltransferase [Prevotella sp.]
MRVLIVNTSEQTGGAAVAASRLRDALNNNGVRASMLVRGNSVADRWHFLWERVVIWGTNLFSRKHLFKVSIANAGTDITKTKAYQEADIIHLHWVNQGLLSLKDIERIFLSGKPVVWTLHDMWPLTAICHHAYECEGYRNACGQCQFLRRPGRNDLSAKVFRKKRQVLQKAHNVTFVTVSEWLAGRARNSALIGSFPIKVIPNVLPLQQFTIINRIDARTSVDVEAKYVIAFGAARIDDPIKGFEYLVEALRLLTADGRHRAADFCLLLFGEVRDASVLNSIPVPYSHLGYIDDVYRLSLVYSASDVTVSSSLYETFGQTLIEAMACGSVPVSFDGAGQADIISHQQNGYLAERLSASSLAEGIAWGLHCSLSAQDLRRSVVRRYSENAIARQYSDLYQKMCNEY